MATNFEFYNEDIQKIINSEEIRCVVGAFADKIGTETTCPDGCYQCYINLFKFLCAEHIEPLKLTKRERAFCEAAQTGRIARDRDGSLCWFPDDAVVQKGRIMWNADKYVCISHFKLQFLCIKWEDEKPWAVEDLLKLEVIEEVQEDA